MDNSLWHDIVTAALAWAIPIIMAWVADKIPIISGLLIRHRFTVTVALSGLAAIFISFFIVDAHDRYFKAQLDPS
jgi:hypothetical protein